MVRVLSMTQYVVDTWTVIGINMFLIVALIGKFGSTIAYCIIYTHTSELVSFRPTVTP